MTVTIMAERQQMHSQRIVTENYGDKSNQVVAIRLRKTPHTYIHRLGTQTHFRRRYNHKKLLNPRDCFRGAADFGAARYQLTGKKKFP